MRSTRKVLACALLAAVSGATVSLADVTPNPNTLALTSTTGAFGPNAEPGAGFFFLLTPRVNRQGQFAWGGTTGDASNSFPGVWLGSGTTRTRLARGGDSVAGVSGATFDSVNHYGVLIDDAGEVLFDGLVRYPTSSSNVRTYLAATPGNNTIVAHLGNGAPPDATTFGAISSFRTNGNRTVAFYGESLNLGPTVFVGEPGSLRAAASRDMLAPGTPFPTVFGANLYTVDVNRTGQMLFHAPLVAAGQQQGGSLYIADSTTTRLLVRSADPAPGFPAGTTMGQVNDGVLGDDGRAAVTIYPQSSTGVTLGRSLYIGAPGQPLRLVATPEMPAPGMPSGTVFGDSTPVVATSPGSFVFTATTHAAGGTGGPQSIWVDEGAGPRLLLASAQSAPGLPGVGMAGLDVAGGNQLGQVLFTSTLFGAGVTAGNRTSFWVLDPVAGVLPVVRAGDSMLLGTGLTKTISSISDPHLGILDPGSPIPGSNLTVQGGLPVGVVTYSAIFTDGTSGIFSLTVPSVGSVASLAVAGIWAGGRRRRPTRM